MEDFLQPLRELDLRHFDFAWTSPDEIIKSRLIPSGALNDLTVFGKQASGSLMAVWKKTSVDELASPVVWMDSEGYPNTVIASNIRQFFSFLPYGTGMIYDLAFGLSRFFENPKSNKRYLKAFTSKGFLIAQKRMLEDIHTKNLIDLMMSKWQITPVADPLQTMKMAIEKEDNFNRWLQTG